MREISVLKEVAHPNVVQCVPWCTKYLATLNPPNCDLDRRLKDVFVSYSGNLYMVFELCDRDLRAYLDTCRSTGMHPHLVRVSRR